MSDTELKLVGLSEAAKMLNRSVSTVRNLVDAGILVEHKNIEANQRIIYEWSILQYKEKKTHADPQD